MRVALVAMPWADFSMPCLAIGALSAWVRREAPDVELECHYAYVDLWHELGPLYKFIADIDFLGELLYIAHLYPEMNKKVKDKFVQVFSDGDTSENPGAVSYGESEFNQVFDIAGRHAEGLAQTLAARADVVGLTTSLAQLFPSLVVARRVKELNPAVHVILGGAMVRFHTGQSVLRAYPFVDHVVQGEGEVSLIALLRDIQAGSTKPGQVAGILSQTSLSKNDEQHDGYRTASYAEIPDVNRLPVPDYSEFQELVEKYSIGWRIPIEGSRGCWWDRSRRTNNPLDKCYFCSDTPGRYRRKDPDRIVSEMNTLSERHGAVRFHFLDSVAHPGGLRKLSRALKHQRKRYAFFHEIRADIQPHDLVLLYEAGCEDVQIGVEGLSTSYLNRLGKGTTAIQNLQAMKICYELGIRSSSYLLTDFPGATTEEVEETIQNIHRFASAYWPPLEPIEFQLRANSSVHQLPSHFGIQVREAEEYGDVLPKEQYNSLNLPIIDFEYEGDMADWSGAREACRWWSDFHQRLLSRPEKRNFLWEKPLAYFDGGDTLEIYDNRGDFRLVALEKTWRDIFLYCMEVRSKTQILGSFCPACPHDKIEEILAAFAENDLMFVEGDQYLSLAVATRPQDAIERIRNSWQKERGECNRED